MSAKKITKGILYVIVGIPASLFMKRFIYCFPVLMLVTTLASCRFHKPLLTFNKKSYEKVDTLTGITLKIMSCKYPRISWWRSPHFTGLYVSNMLYDGNDKLTKEIFSWQSNSNLSDGNLKVRTKICYYADTLKAIRIEYMIDKFRGRGRMPVFRKTVISPN